MLLIKKISKYKTELENGWHLLMFNLFEKLLFKSFGSVTFIGKDYCFTNKHCISVGQNFTTLQRCRVEAITKYGNQAFNPQITIGNNVTFNTDVHIGCINKVTIGNNVLLASRIYISDHSHGETNVESIRLPPNQRLLTSKGEVIIEDNVWIGEGVSILPNVRIGANCIIGANAVVIQSFPANSIIAGVPARLIKTLN